MYSIIKYIIQYANYKYKHIHKTITTDFLGYTATKEIIPSSGMCLNAL